MLVQSAPRPRANAAPRAWAGTLTLAPMAAIYAGTAGDTALSSHLSHTIVIGPGAALEGPDGRGHLAPAGAAHRLVAGGGAVVIAYLDARRYGRKDAERLAERWRRAGATPAVVPSLVDDLTSAPRRPVDGRSLAALDAFARGSPLSGAARAVGLSPSRLTHLVTEGLGAPPRSWRSWLRLRRAVDELASGATVTYAAHACGFADAAHLSRTCSAALGIAPSLFQAIRLDTALAGGRCEWARGSGDRGLPVR